MDRSEGGRGRRGRGGGRGRGRGGFGPPGGERQERTFSGDFDDNNQQGGGGGGGRGGFGKRQYERRSGSDRTGVKAVEKREGGGAHNWGTMKDDLE